MAAKDDGAKSLLAGYILCLIYASLRFDDGKHVKPHFLQLQDGALRGTSWQTKTDRKRAGTNFAVTDTFISNEGWLRKWFHARAWLAFRKAVKSNLFGQEDYLKKQAYIKKNHVHKDKDSEQYFVLGLPMSLEGVSRQSYFVSL